MGKVGRKLVIVSESERVIGELTDGKPDLFNLKGAKFKRGRDVVVGSIAFGRFVFKGKELPFLCGVLSDRTQQQMPDNPD